MVFQDYALFPHLSVADNIGFGLRRDSATGATRRVTSCSRWSASPDRVTSIRTRCPAASNSASLALARCSPSPALLLLDEPSPISTSNCANACRTRCARSSRLPPTPPRSWSPRPARGLAGGRRDRHHARVASSNGIRPGLYHRPANASSPTSSARVPFLRGKGARRSPRADRARRARHTQPLVCCADCAGCALAARSTCCCLDLDRDDASALRAPGGA